MCALLRLAALEHRREELRRVAQLLDRNAHLVACTRPQLGEVRAALLDVLASAGKFLGSERLDRLSARRAVAGRQPRPSLDPPGRLDDHGANRREAEAE